MIQGQNLAHRPEVLLSEMRERVLVLTINRQESYNSWTSVLRDELASKLIAADADENVDAAVLTGAGDRAFCAGQDLAELKEFADGANIEPFLQRLTRCYDSIRQFSKPLVAAINGVAAGSGFQLTQLCDYAIAHHGVRLGQTEVNSGLPSVFGTWLMSERIGSRAYELALQGRLMDATEAKQLGFIQEIVEQSKVLDAALETARRLSKQPRVAFKLSKAANRQFDQERYSTAMKMAVAAYREAFDTGASQKQINQFFESRNAEKTVRRPADAEKVATTSPLYLDASTVQACLSDEEIYETVSQTLRDLNSARVVKGPKAGFGVDINGDHLHMGSVSGCVLSSSAAGIKWFTVAERNPSRNLPRVPATILVCDAETGLLEGILNGTQLTSERTAAMAVAAASACVRRPLKKAAVVGAGAVGRALVKFLATTQPVDHIAVASLRESSARQACEAVSTALPQGVTLSATTDVRQTVSDADVVFTCTGVREDTDLVCASWLKDNVVVCTVGSRREVDVQLLSEAWIVVDDADGVRLRRSDFQEGGAGWNRIAGDIGSVMSGQLTLPPGDKKINLVLVGLGVLDIALSVRAIANARRKGLGIPLAVSPK
ncbi:enoyl-CoA hydratase-related protein [Bradyrhizobium zhanjiangense]|nr:enoyl-CoA hydratase-related protein [Bradyrhizobium zhanjiangense]